MSKRYNIPLLGPEGMHRTKCHIKRSLFICSMGHAPSVDAAKLFVEHIKNEFSDATHNCWAYAAGAPKDTARVGFSDDGEPHGTAGRPILGALLHSDIGELVCVVTRYFGGVKLGTGGLVRAYQGAVLENLNTLQCMQKVTRCLLRVTISYAHIDRFYRLLPNFEALIQSEKFSTQVDFELSIPQENVDAFTSTLANATDGLARVCKLL